MKRSFSLALLLCAAAATLIAGSKGTKPIGIQIPVEPTEAVVRDHVSVPAPSGQATSRPMVGTYTTLRGYYDYQCNGGACQHIRVNPANGNVHVTYMLSEDSLNVSPSRRVGYAFSSNGGTSWNNFNNVRVPSRRAGFPTLDLLRGSTPGLPVIANHNETAPALLTSALYVDSPEGSGAFSELNSPPLIASSDEPIWPYVASPSDGSIVIHSSRSTAATNHLTRTADFSTWTPWLTFPGTNSAGGRYSTQANGTGRVGTLLNAVGNGCHWLESTNNGQSWPGSALPIHPGLRYVGPDTFQAWVGSDFVYDGNTALIAINEINVGANDPTDGAQIVFWTQAGGFVVAATRANTPGVVGTLNRTQVNHFSMGYPAIGVSGSRIVIVYQGFTADTSAVGFNFSDIFYVQSTNGGVTWSTPVNLTNTPNLDERYPSISKWNQVGFANITWQEDLQPGSSAFNDNAPLSLSRQVFYRLSLTTDVQPSSQFPKAFSLSQNYPNPFNPATRIDYSIAEASSVSIKVYNTLGQEIATLVSEHLMPGQYHVTFDGANLPSGVYLYKMTAGNYVETKMMLLLK